MEYSYRDIDAIYSEGIRFHDGREISFQICMQEYQKLYPASTGCVGLRDITGKPPYFEFFMPEHIRVIFDKKGFFRKRKNNNDFTKFYTILLLYSCKTYDLS